MRCDAFDCRGLDLRVRVAGSGIMGGRPQVPGRLAARVWITGSVQVRGRSQARLRERVSILEDRGQSCNGLRNFFGVGLTEPLAGGGNLIQFPGQITLQDCLPALQFGLLALAFGLRMQLPFAPVGLIGTFELFGECLHLLSFGLAFAWAASSCARSASILALAAQNAKAPMSTAIPQVMRWNRRFSLSRFTLSAARRACSRSCFRFSSLSST